MISTTIAIPIQRSATRMQVAVIRIQRLPKQKRRQDINRGLAVRLACVRYVGGGFNAGKRSHVGSNSRKRRQLTFSKRVNLFVARVSNPCRTAWHGFETRLQKNHKSSRHTHQGSGVDNRRQILEAAPFRMTIATDGPHARHA